MRLNRHAMKVIPLAGLGLAVAAALSGCGGATSGGSVGVATPNSGPVIYGLNALAASTGNAIQGETSGVGYTDASGNVIGVLTSATAYTTDSGPGPLPAYQSSFTTGIPLGFAPAGLFFNSSAGAALPTASASAVAFRAYISTGAKNGTPVDLDTNSVVLTSSEAPTFSQKLTFDPNFGNGQLGQGQYTTGTFALPAALTTTGLHNLRATLADVAGQKSHTDFAFVEVAPANVALFLQNFIVAVPATATAAATTKPSAITAGDTVTIDGGAGIGTYPTGYAATTADAQGTVVLFTTPGTHTVTETNSKGTVQTSTFTIASTAAGTTIFDVPVTTAAAVAGSVQARVIKRAVKH